MKTKFNVLKTDKFTVFLLVAAIVLLAIPSGVIDHFYQDEKNPMIIKALPKMT
jgi:hypothetical protein